MRPPFSRGPSVIGAPAADAQLQELFGQFGDVEHVLSRKPGSALVSFASIVGAVRCAGPPAAGLRLTPAARSTQR